MDKIRLKFWPVIREEFLVLLRIITRINFLLLIRLLIFDVFFEGAPLNSPGLFVFATDDFFNLFNDLFVASSGDQAAGDDKRFCYDQTVEKIC